MPFVFQLIIRFILLVAVQIFVLDNIHFMGYINPMIYVLFILSLPIRFPKWLALVLAFALGLIIDIFSNTLGMHTFATVLLAFARYPLINLFTAFDEGASPAPAFRTFGVWTYVKYVTICVFMHHAALFIIESFSLAGIGYIVLKIALSTLVTSSLIFIVQSFKTK